MIKPLQGIQLNINPNPVTNYFKIRCSLAQQSKVEINITSSSGVVIYSSSENANTGINEWTINKNCSPGQYIVEVRINQSVYRKKIMIAQ